MSRAPFSTCNSCPLIVTLTSSADMFFNRYRSPDCDFERVGGGGVSADVDDVVARLGQFARPVIHAVRALDRVAGRGRESEARAFAGRKVQSHHLPGACAEAVLVPRAEPDGLLDDCGRATAGGTYLLGDDAVSAAALCRGGGGWRVARGPFARLDGLEERAAPVPPFAAGCAPAAGLVLVEPGQVLRGLEHVHR